MKDKDLFILHGHHSGCWWYGDVRYQVINGNGNNLLEYLGYEKLSLIVEVCHVPLIGNKSFNFPFYFMKAYALLSNSPFNIVDCLSMHKLMLVPGDAWSDYHEERKKEKICSHTIKHFISL